uniref:Mannose receptor, C type 1b n=1 Tax=Oryzias latipes TaxID=8090 RepID=A0A3P9IWG7_ORYLA
MRIFCITLDILILKTVSADSAFQLINKATAFCLPKLQTDCLELRWTTNDRLLVHQKNKCLGAQGQSVGAEVKLYDCDEDSELQKWECKNQTLLGLKGKELFIEIRTDNSAVLSKTTGPNSHFTISGTFDGACARTYREMFTTGGTAAGKPCMFPFMYGNQWYSDCTMTDHTELWCAVETHYYSDSERWGVCPTNCNWIKHPKTGAYYQLNSDAALTWAEAESSCKQQTATLLSLTDPHQEAYVTVMWFYSACLQSRLIHLCTVPYCLTPGYPLSSPGHVCGFADGTADYSWRNSVCSKRLGYICWSHGGPAVPTEGNKKKAGLCTAPWISYNGRCYQLYRSQKTWSDAQIACRKEEGDLVSIHNVEEQSFIFSELGYVPTDELWIGLNDRTTEGLFDWSDQSAVRFTSWEFGKPGVEENQEDCVLIRGQKGNWADSVCEEKHGFICMKKSEASGSEILQEEGCQTGWKRFGSYCYLVGSETKTFDEARMICDHSQSYLADVSTSVDNAFLTSLVGLRPEKHFWLGLSNQREINVFVWTNTKRVRFTHWNAEMPGDRQGCVAMATGHHAGLWDVLPCANKEKYICKQLAKGAVVTPHPATVPVLTCTVGWTKLPSGNFCFKFFGDKKTWYEAREYCTAIGGDLLSFHSKDDLVAGRGRHSRAWIGLSAPNLDLGYLWSDGSPVNFQHWSNGEPNNKNNIESCTEFSMYGWDMEGSWNDNQCEKYNSWFCQIPLGKYFSFSYISVNGSQNLKDYNTTSDGWLEWKGNQYFINQKSLSMEEARQFCKQFHGDLATINSYNENAFLWKRRLIFVLFLCCYRWMDHSVVIYQQWDEGQPDYKHYDEQCVIMRVEDGVWHDYNCGFEHKSICKRSGPPHANSTVAPTVTPKGGFIYLCLAFLLTQMADAATTDLWIGFHKLHGGEFYWSNGRKRSFVNLKGQLSFLETPIFFFLFLGEKFSIQITFVKFPQSDPKFPDSPEPTIPTGYTKIFNDSFKSFPQNMTWDGAQKYCAGDGANLASIKTEWAQAYVELQVAKLKRPVWIGLNKDRTSSYFRFIAGSRLKFVNWNENEPRSDQSCVYVDVGGKWKTSSCNQTYHFVCMKSSDILPVEPSDFPGVCPDDPNPSSQHYWIPFRGHCYTFFTKLENWPEASTDCSRHGGMIVSIEDPSEQDFIETELQNYKDQHNSFWLGLYKTHKGTWQWLDRTVMDYTNWDSHQPGMATYAEIATSDGMWKTGRPWNKRPYICKTAKNDAVPQPHQARDHIALTVVFICAAAAVGAVIVIYVFRKSRHHLAVPLSMPNIINPLFISGKQLETDADVDQLVENAEENPQIVKVK